MIWEVKIERLEHPNLLVDLALRSPFKYWKHSHIFTQTDEGICELKDLVEYELPFGFLGILANPFIKNELSKMFNFRHRITREILEQTQ